MKAVIKLRDALSKSGHELEVRALNAIIDKVDNNLSDKKIIWSKSTISSGVQLTLSTSLPVDKETGAPLVDVIFPQSSVGFESSHYFNEDIENAINGIVKEWKLAEKLRENNIPLSYSYLFFGPPGTGKTELAKYLACKLNIPLVSARLDSLLSSYLGTSARNISALFDFVEKYDCILLLDEFDAIAKYRDDKREVGEIKRVVNTLLQCLDRRKESGITVATTNHEGLLDPAVWRRFQNKLSIQIPNDKTREKIIKSYIKPVEISELEFKFICMVLDGYTPADIKNCMEYIKRFIVLNNEDSINIYKSVKSYFVVNANHRNETIDILLSDDGHELAKELTSKYSYTIQDVSVLLGKHKSTVSRWLKG
ncbi:AAA family ATPase [Aeromonas veronii]|uniref:AAA family ATPase n=1 Tax=Aeromonas veronii TaxID=654 RepID=UPI002B49B6D1|nr:AAA family ATPase [Aeromonas veronii]